MMTRCIRPRAGAAVAAGAADDSVHARQPRAEALGTRRRRCASSPSARRSPPTCARARRSSPPTRLEIIPNPVDVAWPSRQRPRPRRRRSTGPTRSISASSRPTKGTSHLVDVVERARLDWPLVDRRRWPRSRRDRGRGADDRDRDVRLVGWVDRTQTTAWLAHASLLIFTSRGPESLSRVLLEASALGVPIAAMNTGGTPDIVKHGETGLLSSTPEALARRRAAARRGRPLRRSSASGQSLRRAAFDARGRARSTLYDLEIGDPRPVDEIARSRSACTADHVDDRVLHDPRSAVNSNGRDPESHFEPDRVPTAEIHPRPPMKPALRVAVVARSVFPLHGLGGLERHVYDLVRYLADAGVETTLITRPPKAALGADAIHPRVTLRTVPYRTFPLAGRRGTTVIDRSTAYPLFGLRAGRAGLGARPRRQDRHRPWARRERARICAGGARRAPRRSCSIRRASRNSARPARAARGSSAPGTCRCDGPSSPAPRRPTASSPPTARSNPSCASISTCRRNAFASFRTRSICTGSTASRRPPTARACGLPPASAATMSCC